MPRVDLVAAHQALASAREQLGEAAVVDLVRAALELERAAVRAGGDRPELDEVALRVAERARGLLGKRTRRVINATGVLLHTNLGRAPLGPAVQTALAEAGQGYASLELDLDTGKRGGRAAFVEAALVSLLGCEAALVVNNCAAALVLTLAALARDRSAVVSRGELVEIGGGFRIPDIMAESGARLVEVGTTNKTRASDYDAALCGQGEGASVLRIHQSNFRQLGFVARPTLAELRVVASKHQALLIEDLGSGLIASLAGFGPDEPTVGQSLRGGADLVLFSTDKALGGPQGGAIVGKAELVQRVRRHPLARAFRLGRLPLVALEATLSSYLRGAEGNEVWVVKLANAPGDEVEQRAVRLARWLQTEGFESELVATRAELGGGSVSEVSMPSFALTFDAPVERLAKLLRQGTSPVMGRVIDGRLGVDLRTVLPDEDDALRGALLDALRGASR